MVATFQIDADMLKPLVDQACAALSVHSMADLAALAPAKSGVEGHLLEALRDNKLSALSVVGWETNERYLPNHLPLSLLIT